MASDVDKRTVTAGPEGHGMEAAEDEAADVTSTSPRRRRRSTRRVPEAPRGTEIGRYVIVDPLGRGGMGAVYGAYDPELDRRIALKLVRDVTGDGRARLIAEAQAMAKISHPNVISVHDAGSYADGVFIAMELIDGETLGAWRKQPRTRKEIMAVFDAAGRGLAAAHAAGIVHRDFKPGNVMLGRDGRVRVLDFGLARVGGRGSETPADSPSDSPGDSQETLDEDVDAPRIMASRVMGTPSYMAPEQRRPGMHDARVDQFAFAVALYETLYGERPFDGADAATLALNAASHNVRPPPRNSDVPLRTRRTLLRALSPDPVDRFPTMAPLLEELAHDPAARRRRVLVGVAGAGLAALAVVGLTRARDAGPAPCLGADAPVASVWDAGARARVTAAFRATGRPYAEAWAGRVAAELDRRAVALGAARIATCQATSVRREQSAALLDLRMACLGRRLGELDALIDALGAGPDTALMDRALDATAALPALQACADTEALLTVAPRPTDPALAAELTVAEDALAAAAAARYAADVRAARARAEDAVAAADRTGHGPLRAEARVALVRAIRRGGEPAAAEPAIFEAAELATATRADRTAAEAWIEAIAILTELGRPREALVLVHAASAATGRVGRPGALRADLLSEQARSLESTGDFATAALRQDEALALWALAEAPDQIAIASGITHRARLASRQGDHVRAEELYRRGLELRRALFGDSHPDVASSLDNLGVVAYHRGRLDEALGLYQDALARRIAALGPDHVDVGTSLNNLGGIHLDRGDLAAADEHFTRALATWERALGPDHLDLGIPLGNLGDVALARKDPARALALCKRAYDLEARASGDDATDLAYALTCQGEALDGLGQPAEAIATLERALALREASPVDAAELGRTRLALAIALDRRRTDPARVRRLAVAARDALADAGPTWARRLASAQALAGPP